MHDRLLSLALQAAGLDLQGTLQLLLPLMVIRDSSVHHPWRIIYVPHASASATE
jgi:hypothetical protein